MKFNTPGTIRIAVSGHRHIQTNGILIESIRQTLKGIMEEHRGVEAYLYSALAEGSDQLIAAIAQEIQQIKLIVPLPMPIDLYLMDFESGIGKSGFHQLLKSASEVITLAPQSDRLTAYQYLGNYLIKECDLLFTIWNGEDSMKKGGTSEVVNNATLAGLPVYWIYCDNDKTGSINSLTLQKTVGEIQLLGVK